MARLKEITVRTENELILTPTDTKMAKVLEEAEKLARCYPEILSRIESDQKSRGTGKKVVRIQTQRWREEQTRPLFTDEVFVGARAPVQAGDVELEVGRPRILKCKNLQ